MRFALWSFPDTAWVSQPFYLADGHPPLLSLLMSALLAYVSPLSARAAALAIALGGMWFLFSWSKILRLPVWATFLLGLFILFIPVHREILTAMYSDFPGFVFLMGWAYFRQARRSTPAMLCLLLACSMRETHVLPALVFLVVGWTRLDLRKTAWVECVSVSALAAYYTWSKVSTGVWYTFSGKHDAVFTNLFDPHWLFSILPIVLPLVLVLCLRRLPQTPAPKPLVFELVFLAPLAAILVALLAPYLATYHKARLLTPFISFYWLAVLFHWHNLKLGATPKALEVPSETVVSGDWPHSLQLTFDRLGFLKPGSFPQNRKFFPDREHMLTEAQTDVRLVYFATEASPTVSHLLSQMCQLGCEQLQLRSPRHRDWTIYLRNVPAQTVRDAHDQL